MSRITIGVEIIFHREKFQKKKRGKKELVSIACDFVRRLSPDLQLSFRRNGNVGVSRKIFGPTFDHLERKSTITDGVMQISNNLSPPYSLFFARSRPPFLLIEPLWIYIFRIFPTAEQNSSRSFVHDDTRAGCKCYPFRFLARISLFYSLC